MIFVNFPPHYCHDSNVFFITFGYIVETFLDFPFLPTSFYSQSHLNFSLEAYFKEVKMLKASEMTVQNNKSPAIKETCHVFVVLGQLT